MKKINLEKNINKNHIKFQKKFGKKLKIYHLMKKFNF